MTQLKGQIPLRVVRKQDMIQEGEGISGIIIVILFY
jgi:hypothetical protein